MLDQWSMPINAGSNFVAVLNPLWFSAYILNQCQKFDPALIIDSACPVMWQGFMYVWWFYIEFCLAHTKDKCIGCKVISKPASASKLLHVVDRPVNRVNQLVCNQLVCATMYRWNGSSTLLAFPCKQSFFSVGYIYCMQKNPINIISIFNI